jgi:hypothetical protein
MKGLSLLLSGILVSALSGVPTQQNGDNKDVSQEFMSALSNYVKSTQNGNNDQPKQQAPTSNLKASQNSVSDVLKSFLKAEINHAADGGNDPAHSNKVQNEIFKFIADNLFDSKKVEDKKEESPKQQQAQNLRADQEKDKAPTANSGNSVEKILLNIFSHSNDRKESTDKHDDKKQAPPQNLKTDQQKDNTQAGISENTVEKILLNNFSHSTNNKQSTDKHDDKKQAPPQNLKTDSAKNQVEDVVYNLLKSSNTHKNSDDKHAPAQNLKADYDKSKTLGENIEDAAKDIGDDIKDATKGLSEKLGDGVKNFWDKTEDFFGSIFGSHHDKKDVVHHQNLRAEDEKAKADSDYISENIEKVRDSLGVLFKKLFENESHKITAHRQNLKTENSNRDLHEPYEKQTTYNHGRQHRSERSQRHRGSHLRANRNRNQRNKYNLRAQQNDKEASSSHSRYPKDHKGVLWHKLRAAKN